MVPRRHWLKRNKQHRSRIQTSALLLKLMQSNPNPPSWRLKCFCWDCFREVLIQLYGHFGGCSLSCSWSVSHYTDRCLYFFYPPHLCEFRLNDKNTSLYKLYQRVQIRGSCYIVSPTGSHLPQASGHHLETVSIVLSLVCVESGCWHQKVTQDLCTEIKKNITVVKKLAERNIPLLWKQVEVSHCRGKKYFVVLRKGF